MSGEHAGRGSLQHEQGFRFRVRLGDGGRSTTIITDEASPLGEAALALLSAAVGQCLASSLLFCKAHLELEGLEAGVEATTVAVEPRVMGPEEVAEAGESQIAAAGTP